jgi:hypothetical protein
LRCVLRIGCSWSWPAQFALEVQTCRELLTKRHWY